MNNFSGIGRIGRDAEIRHTSAGKEVTGWPLAVDVGYGQNKSTLWLDCTLWGERGARLADYIRKGDRIGVTGSIRLDTYTTRDGVEKSKVALRVQDVTLLGGKADGGQRTQRQAQTEPVADDFEGDGIPF